MEGHYRTIGLWESEALQDLVSDDSINSYQMTAGVKYL